ncbi:MAG: sugar ABC transporter permease [Thermotogae bacterium]|nr:MAG: sugar ABC transporter permease [Thermotogota bacterium]
MILKVFSSEKSGSGRYLVLPAFILSLLVVAVPELWSLVLSFSRYEPGRNIFFIGFKNYSYVFSDPNFWNSFKNTAIFVVTSVVLQIVLALAFTVVLAKGFKAQKLWVTCVLLPYALSPVVTVNIWKYMIDYNVGIISYFFKEMGFLKSPWLSNPVTAMLAVILVYTWYSVPFSFVILYPARISIPTELYEAASIDGASHWKQFTKITMPLLTPTLIVVATFRLMISLRSFGEIWLLTKGGPFRSTETLAIYLYKQGFSYWNWGRAAAIGWIILLVTMLFSLPQIRTMYTQMFGSKKGV